MPRTKSKTKTRHPWTRTHEAQAKKMIKAGLPARTIANSLTPKRTEAALRQHMVAAGISFRALAR